MGSIRSSNNRLFIANFAIVIAYLALAAAASQAPTLTYRIYPKYKVGANPPANNHTRGCEEENRCRGQYLVSFINIPSGTRIDANATVEGVNRSENGTEAIAYAIAEKISNKTNAHESLSISLEDPKGESQLNAVSRGISRVGLDSVLEVQVQKYSTSLSTEAAKTSSTSADWKITVHKASEWVVELKILTNVTNLDENDMKDILEKAKAIL